MVRVVHQGKYTKNISKNLPHAGTTNDDDDDDEEEEEDSRRRESGSNDDAGDGAGDDDDEDEDDDDEEDEDDDDDDDDDDASEEGIALKPKPKPKRNRFVDDVAEEDDDDDDGGKKRKTKKAKKGGQRRSEFIDDMADVNDEDDDEEDEGDEEDDLDDAERETIQREMDSRLHARMENQGQFERMENEEELEAMIKERYAQPVYRHTDSGRAQLDENVDQQALHPTVRDPKLWLVTVKLGKERETVVCLMQKMINLRKQGKPPMPILSSITQDHLKGYIYVEAEREDQVRKALQGMRHVYHGKPVRLVPIAEMVDSISVTKKEVEVVKLDSWVRMRTGVYKGDLAQVTDVNYADNQCTVKLVPRIDYQHLADKESGAAKGKAKSQVRPPARLFSEGEAKRLNLTFEKGRFDRAINDYVDVLCGTTKIRDGYHMKTCSLATVKLADTPTLDELQKFAVGDAGDEENAGGAGGSLAALTQAIGVRKTDLKFMPGDQVIVVEGDLRNLEGVIERIAPDGRVVVNPSHKELNELLTFKPEQLRKYFKTGSTVRVLHGKHEGVVGMVVKVEGDIAHIFSTVSNEEFQVFMHDLADSDENTQRIDTLGEYALHDLAMLDGSEVGCIVRVEKDVAFVMTNAGTPERPEVRPLKLQDLKKKMFSRNISAQDVHMDTIDPGSMVRIIDGVYKDITGTVEHIYKGTLWIRARHVKEHGGIVCIRARNCTVHGGKGSTGGGLAAQMMSSSGLAPKSPGHALLQSSFTSGIRAELMSPRHQEMRAAPQRGSFGGPRGARRDDSLIGQTKKIRAGVYKGYIGRIVDATDTTVRVELQAQARTVTVQREHLDVPQVAAARDAYAAPRAYNAYDAPGSRTPAHYPMTPAHGGGMTPMHGSMTPAREQAWNPTATPAHIPSDWAPTSTAGTGWGATPGAGGGYAPSSYGDAAGLAGPTPGGYGPTPGAGGPTPGYGVTPGGYGVTPGGYGVTPGGFDAPADDVQANEPAVSIPDDYSGVFIPGVVVRLSNGSQGYVVSVGPAGSSFKVKIGATRLRDGVEVLESVSKASEVVSVKEDELTAIKPEKKDHIIVTTASGEETQRGETGELLSVDGIDGVVRLYSTGDVVILDMGLLARYWQA